MTFPFDTFESHLSADIRSKGQDYWQAGHVDNLADDGQRWVADVSGSDDYTVEIAIADGQVLDWDCNCPYDWGPICKHVAAVLFAIRSQSAGGEEAAVGAGWPDLYAARPTGKKKPADPVEEIISKLNEAELRKLLHYFAKREDSVRSYLLTNFSKLVAKVSKSAFHDLVKSIIATRKGRHGFIEYRDASRLGDELYHLLSESDPTDALATVYLCEEVLRQLGQAVQQADDSSGSIGSAISLALATLEGICDPEQAAPMEVRDYIFDMLLRECESGAHDGYGFDSELRSLATTAVRTAGQAERMIRFLENSIKKKEQEEYGRYYIESAAHLKFQLLEKWRSSAEAKTYHAANMQYPSFRRSALQRAFDQKDWDEVRQLVADGIAQAKADKHPGTESEWKDWLVRLAEATGDTATLIQLVEQKFLNRGDMEQYRKLKGILPKAEFARKVEQWLEHYKKQPVYGWQGAFNHMVARILEEENRWDEMMEQLAETPSLHLLDQYSSNLAAKNQELYAQLYEKCTRKQMERSATRSAYQECCGYLKKIAKLGAQAAAQQLAEEWKVAYPRRRAMLEELKKAGF